MTKIQNIQARQVLDSRGNPTVEVDVTLDCGAAGCAAFESHVNFNGGVSARVEDLARLDVLDFCHS